MTNNEMKEIFTFMKFAWPNAEMFKGGVTQLAPTIVLWTACLPDLDFNMGLLAFMRLCQNNRFPPTIAEFNDAAKEIQSEMRTEAEKARQYFHFWQSTCRFNDETEKEEIPGDYTRMTIARMGGETCLYDERGFFKRDEFNENYYEILLEERLQSVENLREELEKLKEKSQRNPALGDSVERRKLI